MADASSTARKSLMTSSLWILHHPQRQPVQACCTHESSMGLSKSICARTVFCRSGSPSSLGGTPVLLPRSQKHLSNLFLTYVPFSHSIILAFTSWRACSHYMAPQLRFLRLGYRPRLLQIFESGNVTSQSSNLSDEFS